MSASMIRYIKFKILEVYSLANIKSAKKRILVNRTKAERNKSIKSAVKTSIKKVEAAVAASDKEAARLLPKAFTIKIMRPEKFPA